MNLQLVLDVVLEHADVNTLLDCLFLDKHTHGVVMRVLYVECVLMREFSRLLKGQVYAGIKYFSQEFFLSRLEYNKNWYKSRRYFKLLHKKYFQQSDTLSANMLVIYGRLYKFKINPKEDYIRDSDFEECEAFVDDFMELIDMYPHKVSRKLLGCLMWCAYRRGKSEDLILLILDKGFDVNQLLYIGGLRQTVLHFCIYRELWGIIGYILDKNPDLYVYDKNGWSPYRLLKDALPQLPDHIVNKFRKLVKEQKHNHLQWNA
jgi:hypothetical protein